MKLVFDFDGLNDSKIKKAFLNRVDEILERFPYLSNFIDKFLWVWEILNKDTEKVKKIEEFAQKLREDYNIEVLILSSRKVPSDIAISVNSTNPKFKIEKLKEISNYGEDRVIYFTDSNREIKAIEREMREMLRDGKIKVVKI
jgi:ribosomal silencing factor RsfS